MKSKLVALMCFAGFSVFITGCNAGNLVNPVITATANSSCSGMTESQTCTITLTYNTNGAPNVSLSYNSSQTPLPNGVFGNGTFNTSFGVCQAQVLNATGPVTCPVTFTYTGPNSVATNTNLTFTLGSASSSTVSITGN